MNIPSNINSNFLILTFSKNKKSTCQNRINCFKGWHSSDENLSYTPVVDKKEPGDISNDIKENKYVKIYKL